VGAPRWRRRGINVKQLTPPGASHLPARPGYKLFWAPPADVREPGSGIAAAWGGAGCAVLCNTRRVARRRCCGAALGALWWWWWCSSVAAATRRWRAGRGEGAARAASGQWSTRDAAAQDCFASAASTPDAPAAPAPAPAPARYRAGLPSLPVG
jgi:hypothetical protein